MSICTQLWSVCWHRSESLLCVLHHNYPRYGGRAQLHQKKTSPKWVWNPGARKNLAKHLRRQQEPVTYASYHKTTRKLRKVQGIRQVHCLRDCDSTSHHWSRLLRSTYLGNATKTKTRWARQRWVQTDCTKPRWRTKAHPSLPAVSHILRII